MNRASIGVIGNGGRYLAALFIGLSVNLSAATVVHAQGKWANKAPFPEPSEELLGAAANGKLYVFARLAPGWEAHAMEAYDPAVNA